MLRFVLAIVATFSLTLPVFSGESEPSFDDFRVEIYQGTLAKPALSKSMCVGLPEDTLCFWNFRTRIRTAAETNGIMAGGHYTFVQWGCGTSYQSGVLINRVDGSMIWLPTATVGYDFRPDSRLLIVNPEPRDYFETMSLDEAPEWLWREFYSIEDGTLVLEYRDRGPEIAPETEATSTVTTEEVLEDILDTPHPLTCDQQEALWGAEEVTENCPTR